MTRLTITAKGQITLNQELLRHLGVGPGNKINADKLPGGQIIMRASTQDGTIADFIGCLSQRRTARFTIDEISGIAAQRWAK
jgi:hypothetical protein